MPRSYAWDEIDQPEDIWRSDADNDLGYVCGKCGRTPTFREMKNGFCSCESRARKTARSPVEEVEGDR